MLNAEKSYRIEVLPDKRLTLNVSIRLLTHYKLSLPAKKLYSSRANVNASCQPVFYAPSHGGIRKPRKKTRFTFTLRTFYAFPLGVLLELVLEVPQVILQAIIACNSGL